MPTLPLLLDNALANFNYLIYCSKTRDCCVIDPLDVDRILREAKTLDLNITQAINTHEHWDHTGGNEALKQATGCTIHAHCLARDLIPAFDNGIKTGDLIKIGETIKLSVLETPGHTAHSICLYDEDNHCLYTGDTLFNCGCGNCLHGGDPNLMFETFENILQFIPDETLLYTGHNYLRNNLGFVNSLQPKLKAADELSNKLGDNDYYISTMGEDKTADPFFRLDDPNLIEVVSDRADLPGNPSRRDIFVALRTLRNQW